MEPILSCEVSNRFNLAFIKEMVATVMILIKIKLISMSYSKH